MSVGKEQRDAYQAELLARRKLEALEQRARRLGDPQAAQRLPAAREALSAAGDALEDARRRGVAKADQSKPTPGPRIGGLN